MKNLFKKSKVIFLCAFILMAFSAGISVNAAESSPPKNIIFMIGDGMGPNQVAMAHASKGSALHMEGMPYKGTVVTTNFYGQITDSAAAGTALATGVKTINGAVGLNAGNETVPNIREYFAKKNKKTGIISTCIIADATPAAFGSHAPSRHNQDSIANQFITNNIDLIMGGGGSVFDAALRSNAQNKGYTLITKKSTLSNTNAKKVLGLFADRDFPYKKQGYSEDIPTLEEMTKKGIRILDNKNGFFLMSEGGRIDHAGHENNIDCNIEETLEFDKAVKAALDFAKKDKNTLVIVTADHETGGLQYDKSKDEYYFTSKDHSATEVPLYAYGVGAEKFSGRMDNTQISQKIKSLFEPKPTTTGKATTTTEDKGETDNTSGNTLNTSDTLQSNNSEPSGTSSETAPAGNPESDSNILLIVLVIIGGVFVFGGGGLAVYMFVIKK